ncbi:MAG: hypothetical protein ACRDOE_22190, partial [Streptosporangiaceae bacterium]
MVRQGDSELGRVRWGDVERDGRADAGQVLLELAEGGRNWVHVSIVDDATGRPVPCRVHSRSAEGIPYQPHGHHNHVTQNFGSWHYDVGGDIRLGQRSYAYIDGTCQGWLPRGDVVVDVARGFEYEPLRQTVRIEPGQRDLKLQIRADVTSLDLAAQVTVDALASRGLPAAEVTGIVFGWTVPQPEIFYGASTVAARIGAPYVTGAMLSQ